MKKFFRNSALYVLILLLIVFLATNAMNTEKPVSNLKLSEFFKQVDEGNVRNADIYTKDSVVKGELKNGKKFEVAYTEDSEITKQLIGKGVEVKVHPQKESLWLAIAVQAIPFVLIIAFWLFMMQQMQGGGNRVMSFGKSKAKRMSKDQPRVTFKDVAGIDEAVEELTEIKEFLSNPQKFLSLGAKIPKGVLLYGPPGSGKTLLARAVAGEAGVPFFTISGSDFVEMFVGVGASRVRDLFEQAKASSPCIIFMDEIDAVGRHRGAGLGGGHDEREQTLNQLLVEMDGFDIKDNVILIAATNRPDILDPALLRPGRFDRQIIIDRPDLEGRKEILKVHLKGKPLHKKITVDVLARRTPGFTGADLANLVNESALLAARHGKKQIEMLELEEAIDRVIAGPERKTRLISDKEKEVIAYHESGHALVAHVLKHTDPVHKITIIPRGRALGYTLTLPLEDRYLVSKSELTDNLAYFLGGRVAEEMVFGEITTGAHNDLEKTTKVARQMVCEYGMSKQLGPITLGQKQEQVFLGRDFASHPDYSQEIAFEIDKEIRRIIEEAFEVAREILSEHREKLNTMAKALIEHETLEKEELQSLLEKGKLPSSVKKKPKVLRDEKEAAIEDTAKPEKKTVRRQVVPRAEPQQT